MFLEPISIYFLPLEQYKGTSVLRIYHHTQGSSTSTCSVLRKHGSEVLICPAAFPGKPTIYHWIGQSSIHRKKWLTSVLIQQQTAGFPGEKQQDKQKRERPALLSWLPNAADCCWLLRPERAGGRQWAVANWLLRCTRCTKLHTALSQSLSTMHRKQCHSVHAACGKHGKGRE